MIKDSKPIKGNVKLILFELNEVPKAVIEYYVKQYPKSSFAYLIKKGIFRETETNDEGELHPWSTWPTLHRGVTNKIHNIKFINQDLTEISHFPPIWEVLIKNKIDVGIFGSLQSSPPIISNYMKFHLPDTFSPNDDAKPRKLSLFQNLNLELANENKAINRKFKLKSILKFLKFFLFEFFSAKIFFNVFFHIIKESINYKEKTRRYNIQSFLTFEIYFKFLNIFKPRFSTYFTNHVAATMHRFWFDTFPKDFGVSEAKTDPFYSQSIKKSMRLVDKQLFKLIKFCKKNNYDLIITSSMGQEAIKREEYVPEIFLDDLNKFLYFLKLDSSKYELLPAMHPDICVSCKSELALEKLRKIITQIKDEKGFEILKERYKPVSNRINLWFIPSKELANTGNFIFKGNPYNYSNLGLSIFKRKEGTGYHTPKGILFAFGPNQNRFLSDSNRLINTLEIAPTFLDIFNVKIPDYMVDPLTK